MGVLKKWEKSIKKEYNKVEQNVRNERDRVIRRAVGNEPSNSPQPAVAEPTETLNLNNPENQNAAVESFMVKEGAVLEIPKRILENPESLQLLGSGSFGRVYLYESSSQKVAIKQIACEAHNLVQIETSAVFAEIELHKKLNHINIVQYFGSYQSPNQILIIMEHAENGSLRKRLLDLEQRNERLSDDDILDFTRQIAIGLNYLHTQDKPIIHRDLRSANVLISAVNIVKIADFGISKQLSTLATRSGFQTIVGNTFWQAPEMIEYNEGKIGRKVDIWSLGITMQEMAYTGRPPMFELEHFQYMFQLCTTKTPPATPDFVSNTLQVIMNKCLVYDSELRGTAQDVLDIAK